MTPPVKKCGLCDKLKESQEYYKQAASEDGLHRYCKWCCKVMRALEAVRKRDKRVKISVRQIQRALTGGHKCDPSITLAKVFKRNLGVCASCGRWVQPRHASIDHIKPISWGGGHTWDNVQLMHLKCNLRKGNRHDR